MRLLKTAALATISLTLLTTSCKTRRNTVNVDEVTNTPSKISSSASAKALTTPDELMDSLPTNYLRVTELKLPTNPASYERIGLTLSSEGLATQDIYDYTLGDTLDLQTGRSYNVVVQLITGETLVYTNETCSDSHIFTAKEGSNDMILPVCAPAKTATPADPTVSSSSEATAIPSTAP